ncbi:MAG: hypothetical protein A4E49_01548 [Methanosaeta sp. PtaU1.Bin112]|nr:MAG: hypothetical protein A4E49_01548 [Methanosaeta sp. PtaU1.Bin112]
MKDEFERKTFEQKVSYLIDNLRQLPDELANEGIEVLAKAGETEYAVVLARDKGMTDKAIAILTDAGDYLWAALIARNAGQEALCQKLYRDGLQYYTDMEMFGRAISAATALGISQDEIDDLYRRGVARESQGVDLAHSRDLIDCAMQSLDMSIIGRDDELSRQVMQAVHEEMEKNEKK